MTELQSTKAAFYVRSVSSLMAPLLAKTLPIPFPSNIFTKRPKLFQ
ncbi:MAG: hypothetical protein ACI9O4_002016 [Chitinophagales bacterium]|jgi:hypothetical protein